MHPRRRLWLKSRARHTAAVEESAPAVPVVEEAVEVATDPLTEMDPAPSSRAARPARPKKKTYRTK